MKSLSRWFSLSAVALMLCLAVPAQASPADHPLDLSAPLVLASTGPMLQTAQAVLAQTAAPAAPAPSIFQGVLDWAGSSAGIATILSVLLGGLGLLVKNANRKQQVGLAIYHAFHAVEDASAEWPENTTLRKVEEGLKAADDYMKANGWRPLKREEQALAQLGFTSMNGQQKAAEKVQSNAIAKVIAATAPTAPATASPQ